MIHVMHFPEVKSVRHRISEAEAVHMDPQGRVLLEQSGLALADAASRSNQPTQPATGVYVGVMHMEYIQYMAGIFTRS
jgi:acyl transferase domain-containing protein